MSAKSTEAQQRQVYAQLAGWVGLALIVAGFCVFAVTQIWGVASWVLVGLGVLAVVGYVVYNFELLKDLFGTRGFQTRAAGSTLAVLAVVMVGFLNFIAEHVGHAVRFDASRNQQFSLADETVKAVKGLEKPLKVSAFFRRTDRSWEQVEDTLQEYKYLNPGKFSYEVVDPQLKPGEARKAGIKRFGTTVFEYGDNKKETTGSGEQDFTSAIISVTRPKRAVYFLTGDGELDTDDSSPEIGLSNLKDALGRDNYDVKKFNALTEKEFPKDCAVLVIAGSKVEMPEKVRKAVSDYLKGGGRAVVLLAPAIPRSGAVHKALMSEWGIDVGNDVVLDFGVTLMGGSADTPAIVKFNSHEITRGLQAVVFADTRSVRPAENKPTDISISSLLETSANSYAERDLGALMGHGKPHYVEGKDLKGPVPVGVAATKDKTRLVVFGNSMFATNQLFYVATTGDLILNAINWAAGQEELISIHAKTPETKRVDLTNRGMNLILLVTIVLMPLAVLVAGGAVWYVRR